MVMMIIYCYSFVGIAAVDYIAFAGWMVMKIVVGIAVDYIGFDNMGSRIVMRFPVDYISFVDLAFDIGR